MDTYNNIYTYMCVCMYLYILVTLIVLIIIKDVTKRYCLKWSSTEKLRLTSNDDSDSNTLKGM